MKSLTGTIAVKLGIEDRVERMAKNQAFITLKDHKDNVINNPKCRLINPMKSDIGRISKQILEKINKNIRETSKYHQWRNTSVVIDWFKNIPDKNNPTFTQFDIETFTLGYRRIYTIKLYRMPKHKYTFPMITWK